MTPKDLIRKLYESSGMKTPDLARKINHPKCSQPQLHKLVNGKISNPSDELLRPFGAFFGIESTEPFRSEEAATAAYGVLFNERGEPVPGARVRAAVLAPSPAITSPYPDQLQGSLGDALILLAQAMSKASDPARRGIKEYVSYLMDNCHDEEKVQQDIGLVLSAAGDRSQSSGKAGTQQGAGHTSAKTAAM